MSPFKCIFLGTLWCFSGQHVEAWSDPPMDKPDPCLDVQCIEGWACAPVDLPDCQISVIRQQYCDPTPVCLPAPKVGECPASLEIPDSTTCDNLICFHDDSCPGNQKCCETDYCGKICLDPLGKNSGWRSLVFGS